jgi:hypothetical protein
MFISALPSVYFTRQTVTFSKGIADVGVKGGERSRNDQARACNSR